jgi:hypothetical protein
MKRFAFLFIIGIAMTGLFSLSVYAEIKVIEADSTYVIGDNDSKVDARRIAVQESQRKALELSGTYVSSLTQVKDFQLTKDEVTAYTAGVMETEIVSEEMKGTADRPSIYIKTRCKIDTDVLLKQIEQFQDNEELKGQLVASQKENDSLKKERDGLQAQLAAEKDKTKIEDTRKKLDTVLTKEETNADVTRVWSAYSRKVDISDPAGPPPSFTNDDLDKSVAVLDKAVAVDPKNPRARILLAKLHELKGGPAAAEQQLRTAITANPTNPLFHMKLGLLLDREGKYKAALDQFLLAERLRPRDPFILFHTGMTYKNLGQCRQAVSNLKRFLATAQKRTSPRMASMKRDAVETIRECEGKPRGPAGRQRPWRR